MSLWKWEILFNMLRMSMLKENHIPLLFSWQTCLGPAL